MAVNRIAHFGHIPQLFLMESSAAVAQLVEHQPLYPEVVGSSPTWEKIFHMLVPTSVYTVSAELSYLGFGLEGNSKTAQPYN